MKNRHALIIGNSLYIDEKLLRLKTPEADVIGLSKVLEDPEIGGFEVKVLLDQPVESLRREIARFFSGHTHDDLLLFYFSGHGIRDDLGNLFLAAKDTEYSLLDATAIPASYITNVGDRSHSRRQVLILDCCYSGAFVKGIKSSVGDSIGTIPAFKGNGYGRYILTASDVLEFAWQSENIIGESNRSVFTNFVIQGLSTGEADINNDGQITVDELYDYAYEQISRQPKKQTPSKWSLKEQGEVILAKNRFWKLVPLQISEKINQTPEINKRALILTEPIAKFEVQYGIFPIHPRSEQLFRIRLNKTELGRCGVSPILDIRESTNDSGNNQTIVLTTGYQAWLFDAKNRHNAVINLVLQKRYKDENYRNKLSSKAKTICVQRTSRFYLETEHLLLQGTVEEIIDSYRMRFRLMLAQILDIIFRRERKKHHGLSMTFVVWNKQ